MIFASITSVHTVFSMFMVSTPNPRPFKFTLSVLYNALQCRSGYTQSGSPTAMNVSWVSNTLKSWKLENNGRLWKTITLRQWQNCVKFGKVKLDLCNRFELWDIFFWAPCIYIYIYLASSFTTWRSVQTPDLSHHWPAFLLPREFNLEWKEFFLQPGVHSFFFLERKFFQPGVHNSYLFLAP